ncbi:MAG: nucleic acid-binding protein [Blastocatellia bacterium]
MTPFTGLPSPIPLTSGTRQQKAFDQTHPDISVVTTEEVLTEFLNFYAEAGQHRRRIVSAMCEQILFYPNVTVLAQTHESFSEGVEFYRLRDDKGYSLTDCISMLVCRKRGIQQVLTRDHHFEQEGFMILF